MKKIVTLILTLSMAAGLAACGKKKAEEEMVGGYTKAETPVLTAEQIEMTEQATEGMIGAGYEPKALLSTQVVSGTNYQVLCREELVLNDPVTKYAVVTVYQPLDGKPEVTGVLSTKEAVDFGEDLGSWVEAESPVVTEEAGKALENAKSDEVYTPAALVAQQVVSGTNYCILCTDKEGNYQLVYVYSDTEGKSEITQVVGFE